MKHSNQKRILLGLALAFGLQIFVAFLLLASADQENKIAARVIHTRDVLDKIDEMVTALSAAETGRRGYILSGDQRYGSNFTNQVERAYVALGQLRELTKDNPPQTEGCDRLKPLIQERLTLSTNSIQARQEKGLDAAAQATFMEQGQQAMELVRQLAAQMADRESALLKKRQEFQDKNVKGVEGFAVLLGLCGLGIFAALFVLFWRADVRRRRAEESLERSNQDLEQRVKERIVELSQSEQRAAQERNLLRTVIDNLPAYIYLKDAGGHYVLNNLANVRAMNARSEAETLGKTVFDFFPEETARLYDADDRQVLGMGEPFLHREVQAKNLAGDQFWLLTTKVPLRDSQGTINGLLGISQDITERKQAEETLRQSEARYRTLFDTLIEGFCTIEMIFDSNGKPVDYRFLEINPAFERQTGLHNAQGKLMRDLAPNHEDHWFNIYGNIALTGKPEHFENEAKALGRHYDVCAYRVGGAESRKVAILFNDITERKRAEAKVAWLASFPERNPNPIIEVDLARGELSYCNPFAVTLFPDLQSRGLEHPFLAGLRETAEPLLSGRVDVDRHHEVVIGENCYAQTISYVPDTQRLRIYSNDITERKRSEETRERLAAIVESSDDAIFSKSLESVITSWNPGAERLFGYTAEEAIGKPMQTFIPPELVGEESEILARIARGESVHHFETQRLKRDGVKIEVSLTVSPIRESSGRINGASGIARDITQSKEAEAKIRAQLSRLDLLSRTTRAISERQDLASILQVVLRSLEDHLPIDFGCVCLYEPNAPRLTVANVGTKSQALAQELAMEEHAHIDIDQNGLSRCVHGELVYEPDIRQINFPFPARLARGGLASLVSAPLLVESQVFGVLVAARRQANSFSSGDCEFLRQLSEHVALAANQAQLYTALQQAYDDLRKTQLAVAQQERLRALGQMASGIAHDINNAISPVAIYSEFLLENEPNLSPRAREYLQTISAAIQDVAATVVRMREFYRQREPQLTLAPLQLNALVEQVLNLTHARWSDMPQQRGIVVEIRTDLAGDLPAIMGVESEIREALINLIFNAVDAMPNGGTLTLRTRVVEGSASAFGSSTPSVCVEVLDTGLGMDEDTQRRCLEPFFTTKGERGTGLGLAMVYGMAQRHSAEIEIESALGKGTIFRLSFVLPKPGDHGPELPESFRSVTVRLRMLVVDDDPMLLKSLCDVLEGDGHIVVTANGGQAGIDAFAARFNAGEPFDVVITDLGMPYIDGRRVAATVKGISSSTPVIMLTGWGHRLRAEGNLPESVDRVLSKPPKLVELRDALARCTQLNRPES